MVLQGASVLVIDDEPHTRLGLMQLLMRAGAHVDGVASGREAFMLCRRRHFDVVVTDLGLPDTPGNVLIRAIRAVSSPTCVIAMTAEREPLSTGAREAGADVVFSKSARWRQLLAYLRTRDLARAA
jgi:DNA-binding response OmpR family regulator